MIVTANGKAVLALRLTLPISGVWVASLEADADEALAGAVEIVDDDVRLQGTIMRSGAAAGTCDAELVGGKGGMSKDVPARSYQGAAARLIATELLAAVGEQLDARSTPAVLATTLPYWTRAAGRAGTALTMLTDALGARWRVLPGGTVWLGVDTWAAAAENAQAVEIDRDAAAGTVLLAPDSIALAPGVTLAGGRVGRVEHHFERDSPLRTTFWIGP